LAALVVAIVTGIILRNYISEKQREVYRNLAQVIVAFDKGVLMQLQWFKLQTLITDRY